jgi:hypothetical protein
MNEICGTSEAIARYDAECYAHSKSYEAALDAVMDAYDWDTAEAYSFTYLVCKGAGVENIDEVFDVFRKELFPDLDFECVLPANWDTMTLSVAEARKAAAQAIADYQEYKAEREM